MTEGMLLLQIPPKDLLLWYVICPHCEAGFGKGERPELAFVSVDQKTAIHKRCVDELASMDEPAEVRERFETAREQILAERDALAVKSRGGRRAG